MPLKSKYPRGAEKLAVEAATGRRIAPGKLPYDAGCVVMNVSSAAFIARYLKSGKPLVSRTVTVDGPAVARPKNVRLPIGISAGEAVDFCGGFTGEPYKLIIGGPMMGAALARTDTPLQKKDNAVLAFLKEGLRVKRETACIRCGRCSVVCPMRLTPALIGEAVKTKNIKALDSLGVSVCMECGSCAYACPAGKPLVQFLRLGKELSGQGN